MNSEEHGEVKVSTLGEARKALDQIDDQLLDLLSKRTALTADVKRVKLNELQVHASQIGRAHV